MKKTLTLIEVIMTVFIFSIITLSIFTFLFQSYKSFKLGKDKLYAQQEARKAVIWIHRLLRQSAPSLIVNNTSYPLNISESNTKIDFYIPVMNNSTVVKKITFKLNPNNSQQLLKKEGTLPSQIISSNITNLYFGGACNDCLSYDCTTVSENCPIVNVNITTKINQTEYNIFSKIYLRNKNITLSNTSIEEGQDEEETF